MKRRTLSTLAALVLLGAVAALLLVPAPAGADPIFPRAGSPVQEELWRLFTIVGWLSVVISVIVVALMVYAIVKFRGDPLVKKKGRWFTHNNRLEITWTVLTALVLVVLGVLTAQAMDRVERPPEETMEAPHIPITVIGNQWFWEFAYPDGTTTEDALHIEAGQIANMRIISCDVIHSLFIPEFGVKIDTRTVPPEVCETARATGLPPEGATVNKFWFKADEVGEYRLQCAEYCGTGHAFMEGKVVVFEPGSREKPYGPPKDLGKVRHVEIAEQAGEVTVSPSNLSYTAGDLTTWFVWNNASSERTLTIPAPYDLSTGPIPPGERAELRFPVAHGGTFNYTVDGAEGVLEVAAGRVVPVELDEWTILNGLDFEAGETVAFKVFNNGTIPHNYKLGAFSASRDARVIEFGTETFPAGQVRWLNVTLPTDDLTFDAWCDVPGHAEQGMLTDVTVGEGGERRDTGQAGVLLPASGVVGAVAALGLAAALAAGVRRWSDRRDGRD